MDLSPHFSLTEMTRSDTGLRHGLKNDPSQREIDYLHKLCDTMMEPIRALLCVPIHVNSGFRCPEVNALVKGKPNSAHLDGRACDFVPMGMGLDRAMNMIISSGLPYDQLILEYGAWIHVSIPKDGQPPRKQVINIT